MLGIMKNLLVALLLLVFLPFKSHAQSIAANQEKYKIVASAQSYGTYPYYGLYNLSLTDLGSSVAFVTQPVSGQDKNFIKIDSLGQIFNLTTISGLYGDNYTGS